MDYETSFYIVSLIAFFLAVDCIFLRLRLRELLRSNALLQHVNNMLEAESRGN